MAVSKESILAYKPKLTPVEAPEWGGTVYVRVISGTERTAYEQSCITVKGKSVEVNTRGARGRLVALCLVDENGQKFFGDGDEQLVDGLPADVLDRVFAVAQRVNGITKEDVDELVGNSDSAPANFSGTT